jgi:hypothetical protein
MAKTLSDSELAKIHAHIFAHRKIQAIKLYREASGEGLKEAKDAVEAMTSELRETAADRFAPESKGGCLPMLVVAILVGAAVGIGVSIGGCARKTREVKPTCSLTQTAATAPAMTALATSLSSRVVGSVYSKPVTAADIGLVAPIDTTVKFDARDDALWDQMGRIAVAFGKPVFDRFVAEHPVEVTAEEIAAFQKPAGPKVSDDSAREWLAQWKTERELHRAYGGRVIFQQFGLEATGARRRLYEEAEKKGDLHFADPGVRHLFYYYYINMGHGFVDEKELEDPAFLRGGE